MDRAALASCIGATTAQFNDPSSPARGFSGSRVDVRRRAPESPHPQELTGTTEAGPTLCGTLLGHAAVPGDGGWCFLGEGPNPLTAGLRLSTGGGRRRTVWKLQSSEDNNA